MSLRTLMPFARSGSVESRTNTDPFQVMRHEMERVFDRFDPAWRGSSGFNGNGFDIPSVDIAESEIRPTPYISS